MQGKTVVLTRTYMRTCIMLFQVPSLNEGTGQVILELVVQGVQPKNWDGHMIRSLAVYD